MIPRIFFLAFLFSLSASPLFAQNREVYELHKKGVDLAKAGRHAEAVQVLEKAQALAPNDEQLQYNFSGILTDWSVHLYNKGQIDAAMRALEAAVQQNEENASAWYFLGDLAYLAKSDFDLAIKAWRESLKNAPSNKRAAITDRLERAETDRRIERSFTSVSTPHFQIRFEEGVDPQKARHLGTLLEKMYDALATELGVSTPVLTLIIYPEGSFGRLTSRFDWAIGFYDGRIRMREEDLGAPQETTILIHELAHAFLHHGFGFNIPTWVHEGYAQAKEPERPLTGEEENVLSALKARTSWIPLDYLDRRFEQPSRPDDITRAYLESSLIVDWMLKKHGAMRFRNFLTRLSQGDEIESAFDRSFSPSKWSRVSRGNLN